MNAQQVEKLNEIEKLVEEDVQNGRTIQKKLCKRLNKNGLKSKDFCKQLQNLKLVK